MFCVLIIGSLISSTGLNHLGDIYHNTKYVISSPLRWDRGDWLTGGLILGATAGLMFQDDEIQNWVQNQRTPKTESISSLIEPFGSKGAAITVGGIYLSGYILNNTRLKRAAILSTQSVIISGIIVGTIKVLAGRARPFTGKGAFYYSPFYIHRSHRSHRSLPSGHTSTAFAIASSLSAESENRLVGIIAYCIAIAVGLSRIHDNEHWASDVLLGASIGIGVGKVISRLH